MPQKCAHRWRTDRVWPDGETLKICKQCGQTKITGSKFKMLLIMGLVIAISLLIIYLFSQMGQ